MAVGWTFICVCVGILHVGDAFHADCGAAGVLAPGFYFDLDPQLVARHHWPPETGALDSCKHHEFLMPVLDFGQQQCAASLSNGFNDQNPRHDWQVWKVSCKKRLVDGDILDGNDALLASEINDPVDEQERKPVGENPQNVLNIKPGVFGRRSFGGGGCNVRHSDLIKREDYTLSHAPGDEMETCGDRAH